MRRFPFCFVTALMLTRALMAAPQKGSGPESPIPRTPEGKPNFSGVWQASSTAWADLQDHAASYNMLAGRSVVAGGEIPYQPWAAKKRAENFQNRQTADPVNKCFMPGVPRIMYMDYPFQIFQTPKAIAMAFEWSLDYRLIYTDGSEPFPDLTFWMGDSRGRWEGDTLVVNVTNHNDKTWFDMAGDFHSDALKVTERYRMTDADTIQYEATIEDSKVFTRPWTIRVPLKRRADRDRVFEYVCQAEVEEANGDFTRDEHTWYPGSGAGVTAIAPAPAVSRAAPVAAPRAADLKRTADGKPDIQGLWETAAGGANQGLERRGRGGANGRGIIDPPDGKLPMQPWAVAEVASRNRTERGYDDPTAHCFPAGVPRSLWVPSAYEIIQTPDYIVFLHERVAWRIVALNRPHLPDSIRLWQGDSVGHWEGDTLVVDTANFNGKTWLNEGGEIVSYAEHVVERFTPVDAETIQYLATITDPVVYTRPWTVAYPIRRQKGDLIESACHEEDKDLPHLKALKDAAAAKK